MDLSSGESNAETDSEPEIINPGTSKRARAVVDPPLSSLEMAEDGIVSTFHEEAVVNRLWDQYRDLVLAHGSHGRQSVAMFQKIVLEIESMIQQAEEMDWNVKITQIKQVLNKANECKDAPGSQMKLF